MEKLKGINPSRITWCCDDLGVTLEELARDTNIAVATLEKVIKEEGALTFKQLQKLAVYFGRGILFFLETSRISEANVHSIQFRTLNNQKPQLSPGFRALVERVERQRLTYMSLREDLGEEAEVDWYPRECIGVNLPERAAVVARSWLSLDSGYSFADMRAALEEKNILVFVSNGYAGKWQIPNDSPIRGFSLYFDSFPIIFVKKQQSEGAQAFTMMHELAHLILHRASFIDDENDYESIEGKEVAANMFAGNLLIPENFLAELNLPAFPHDEVAQYDGFLEQDARRWCVSPEVILRRMMDLDLLSVNNYEAYRDWKKARAVFSRQSSGGSRYRYREPVKIFGKKYVGAVFDALHEQHISLVKASSYLDYLKIADLRKLEDAYEVI